jgi:NADH:ubiquinone oxidoreductase subunit 4 (subunit M)
LRKITTLASISFFARTNILMFFICFELVLLPIILIVLVYGSQPEKIRRLYYAIIYTGVFSISFVIEIIHLEG